LLEFHVNGSWNPDIVPGATAAMGGGKARTSQSAALCQRILSKIACNLGEDLYQGRGRRAAATHPGDLLGSALQTMHQPVYSWQIRFYFAIYLVEI
jgi:hypothetical protein